MALSRTFIGEAIASPSVGGTSSRSRIQCCSAKNNLMVGHPRMIFPSTIVFPTIQQEEDEDGEFITMVNYSEKTSKCSWLTPEYLDLRLRSSSLLTKEASQALKRHFKRRHVTSKSTSPRLPIVRKLPPQMKEEHSDRYVRQMCTLEVIQECIFANIQHEYFKGSITCPFFEPMEEPAAC